MADQGAGGEGGPRAGLDVGWMDRVADAPVFRPSMADFESPIEFISEIEAEAARYGICKIVPPPELACSAALLFAEDSPLSSFCFDVRQQRVKDFVWLDFNRKEEIYNTSEKYTIKQFEEKANQHAVKLLGTSTRVHPKIVEAEYWRERLSVGGRAIWVEYGNDVEGTGFLPPGDGSHTLSNTRWNLKELAKDKGSVLRHIKGEYPGISQPMLYVGSLFATFYWHVEDHFMHSINFMHCGAPKTWYGVPGSYAEAFDGVALKKVYAQAVDRLMKEENVPLESALAHALRTLCSKSTLFSPEFLIDAGIPVYRVEQCPGEFVVTFPRSYHAGFSHGFNIGEAVNFVLPEWFPMGSEAVKRYWYLRLGHILPHEEMLCKEAASIGYRLSCGGETSRPDHVVMREFVKYVLEVESLKQALKDAGLPVVVVPAQRGNSSCMRCGRKCFLSHVHVPGDGEKYLCLHCALCARTQCLPSDDDWCGYKLCGWQVETKRYALEFQKVARLFRKCGDFEGSPLAAAGQDSPD
ncbi:unnamed protein product [Ostreobium quekettii]|uniref:Uncharacterized protein n=1 Tax=Ostreobium quekettii TaxID=121088 RepID=A0A8S1INH6_9CHLO|nr:unnamed protein product [Ostreobium quekettii]|eukprot:evm.model.scf_7.22 EVM.evm.TU.scf_7.22   scf_7:177036-183454(-)